MKMDHMNDLQAASGLLLAQDVSTEESTGGLTDFDRFLARAATRRAHQEANPARLSGNWVDPDPKAITELPDSRHPIGMLLEESKQTPGHIAKRKYVIRYVCAELSGRARASVTWEDVMAYPWHHVTPDTAREFRRAIRTQYPNRNTRHSFMQTLRSIIGRCRRANLMSLEAAAHVLEQLPTKGARGRARLGRCLSEAEVSALIAASGQGDPFLAARDAAMFAVMATTGMRVSELTGLDLADWDRSQETLELLDTKNGQDRVVPVDERVVEYLEAWMGQRGGLPGPLFTPIPCRAPLPSRLTTKAVQERLAILTQRAGIGRVQTHDFRRTVATTLLRSHDAALVAGLLGHSSLAATLTYDLSGQEQQRSAIATLPLPLV
jgi:integrase